MGLAIVVGMMAKDGGTEGAEWMRESLAIVNGLLERHAVPTHVESTTSRPESSRCLLDGFPYSWLHYLRRVYAHVASDPDWTLEAPPEGEDATDDPLIAEIGSDMDSHLLCHSDAEGFYVPVDFSDVIFDESDELPGAILGSSQQLMRELERLAPYLGIELVEGALTDADAKRLNDVIDGQGPFFIELCVWFALFEAARLSVKYEKTICFA
jgi:hypothetical protein